MRTYIPGTIFLLLLGCGPSEVQSPTGEVYSCWIAYSPDGRYYAEDIKEDDIGIGIGGIGIYNRWTNELVYTVPDSVDKGIVWSPNSRLIAVMHHNGSGGSVRVYDIVEKSIICKFDIKKWWHQMSFISNNLILLGLWPVNFELLGVPLT